LFSYLRITNIKLLTEFIVRKNTHVYKLPRLSAMNAPAGRPELTEEEWKKYAMVGV